jgi:PAS domain S-box-containing protein
MSTLSDLIKYTTPLKLLYVEDNEEARNSTLIILQEFFNSITIAINGAEGIEKFKSSHFDLIITDINMPKKNGLEMIGEIKELDKEIPVLVLSAYNEANFFVDSIKLGVEGYILKPVDISQFISMLDKIVQKLKLKTDAEKNLYLLNQYQKITDGSTGIIKSDKNGLISYVNELTCQISGYKEVELLGQTPKLLFHPDNDEKIYEEIWNVIKDQKNIWQGTLRNIKKDGSSYYENITIHPIVDKQNNIVEYISLHSDVTNVMNPKKQLIDLLESCSQSIVVLFKIEKFDDIEVYYGLNISQQIEEKFSERIMVLLDEKCIFHKLFNLGRGEYALATEYHLEYDIEKIIQALKQFQKDIALQTLDVAGVDYEFSTIMSISYGQNTLINARYGMKKLKKTSQEFVVANDIFEEEQKNARNNLETIKMVKSALEEDRIVSYFQPIIDNTTQQIDKYESLVRLVEPDGKVLSPYFFLDIAKKSKYYSQITARVLESSFQALCKTDKKISINLSALDIEKKSTRDKIFELITSHKKEAHRIVFELLEDEDVKDFKLIKEFISEVKERGIQIAIDDFGSGYSNFERLLDYQPDIVKIDGSLVKNILTDTLSYNIVETIVTFAKKQKLQIVAEFVENQEIFIMLKDLGIDFSQGYYFGKPSVLEDKEAI